MNYYNEHDPYAAQWLRNLIAAGHLPDGDVDERSIEDVVPGELLGYTQCHFFAGIGGWPLALQLAGWPATRPVWTGSCPCQPFSKAGKQMGFADERHLWPAFFHLIHSCGPSVVMGEQVAGPDGLVWLDLVQADLEGAGYACRAADLCAAGVGAPHLRQRLYWVADLHNTGLERWQLGGDRAGEWPAGASGLVDWVADPADGSGQRGEPRAAERIDAQGAGTLQTESASGPLYGFWGAADWLFCKDGKWRPVEPGTQPLAYGVPARVGRLRGYGNAIVSQVAAKFIQSLGAQA